MSRSGRFFLNNIIWNLTTFYLHLPSVLHFSLNRLVLSHIFINAGALSYFEIKKYYLATFIRKWIWDYFENQIPAKKTQCVTCGFFLCRVFKKPRTTQKKNMCKTQYNAWPKSFKDLLHWKSLFYFIHSMIFYR